MPNNLRKIRRDRGLTLQQLAERTGASVSLLHKMENDERSLDKWKDKLARALECHRDDLDVYDLYQEPKVPVVGYVGAGAQVYPFDDHAKGSGFAEADCPPMMNPKKTIALEVRGDSMDPLIMEGFLLFYEERLPGVPIEYVGKICVVWLPDGRCLVKKLQKNKVPGHFNLISLNPSEPPMLDVIVEYSAMVKVMVQR